MDSKDLYMKHTSEMLADIAKHIASGDYHCAALVTASLSSTLATMLSIYRFEAGVADERAKYAATGRAGKGEF